MYEIDPREELLSIVGGGYFISRDQNFGFYYLDENKFSVKGKIITGPREDKPSHKHHRKEVINSTCTAAGREGIHRRNYCQQKSEKHTIIKRSTVEG